MVEGIGIDIVKIEKMKSAIEKWGQTFINKVFSAQELENINPGKVYYQRLAARFAAKEAVIKAISKKYPLSLTDIVVLNKKNGAPFCKINKESCNVEILLSISHIEDYAVACAVAQKKI